MSELAIIFQCLGSNFSGMSWGQYDNFYEYVCSVLDQHNELILSTASSLNDYIRRHVSPLTHYPVTVVNIQDTIPNVAYW